VYVQCVRQFVGHDWQSAHLWPVLKFVCIRLLYDDVQRQISKDDSQVVYMHTKLTLL